MKRNTKALCIYILYYLHVIYSQMVTNIWKIRHFRVQLSVVRIWRLWTQCLPWWISCFVEVNIKRRDCRCWISVPARRQHWGYADAVTSTLRPSVRSSLMSFLVVLFQPARILKFSRCNTPVLVRLSSAFDCACLVFSFFRA